MSEKKPAKQRATTTAKTATAKPPAKRKRKVAAARALVDAPPDRCFWVNFGPVLKNLRELHAALAHISEAQFAHHVGAGRNDFADWVEGVLDDVTCAKALRRAKTRASAVRVVEKHLAAYA